MKLILIISLLFVSSLSMARIDHIFDDHTSIPKPFELRDPFQSPKFKSKAKKSRENRFKGEWNEEIKLQTDIPLDQVVISGVLIGKNRRVLIDFGGKTYKLKEEDKLGPNGPRIKAILPGGIMLVEQITNIYGEAEYIETVIPISK